MKIQPVIKWSGSKRSQSEKIVEEIKGNVEGTYYEPFVGGGSVLYQLLHSEKKFKHYIASDINEELIALWNKIKDEPLVVADYYGALWYEINSLADVDKRKEYFYNVRARFNKDKNPLDFLFISRTCTNGLIRYNKKGEFNNSYHSNRKGINPNTFRKIILDWSNILNEYDVQFIHQSYQEIETTGKDCIYLDPPYANGKSMYFGILNYDTFWEWLKKQKGDYLISFDGKTTNKNFTYDVPKELFSKHTYIPCGKSSFNRMLGNQVDVFESLYLK